MSWRFAAAGVWGKRGKNLSQTERQAGWLQSVGQDVREVRTELQASPLSNRKLEMILPVQEKRSLDCIFSTFTEVN